MNLLKYVRPGNFTFSVIFFAAYSALGGFGVMQIDPVIVEAWKWIISVIGGGWIASRGIEKMKRVEQ